jgi:hypothetical protein
VSNRLQVLGLILGYIFRSISGGLKYAQSTAFSTPFPLPLFLTCFWHVTKEDRGLLGYPRRSQVY